MAMLRYELSFLRQESIDAYIVLQVRALRGSDRTLERLGAIRTFSQVSKTDGVHSSQAQQKLIMTHTS